MFISSQNHCNSLPPYTNLDINNDKDKYKETVLKYFEPDICESKYISPDCMNEYYEIKHIFKEKYKEKIDEKDIADLILKRFNSSTLKLNKKDKIIRIEIDFKLNFLS